MLTSRRMAVVDRNAAALGIPRRALMESSANALARTVDAVSGAEDRVCVVAGTGDNGGDGLAAARFLDQHPLEVVLVGRPDGFASDATAANWAALERADIDRTVAGDSTAIPTLAADVIVDGLLGTGLAGPVREPVASAIEAINATDATVVAADVPSGRHPDTGERHGVAVRADHVVTFHDRTPGLEALDVPVTIADIGIPAAAERFVGPGDVQLVPDRAETAHKGDHGRVLVVGGGPYAGAPALTALAALRAGADLAEVAVPASVADTVAGFGPDLIVSPLPGERLEPGHIDDLAGAIDRADVLAIGPGLGEAPETATAVRELLERAAMPTVVDADALAALPESDPAGEVIATPHAGEFAAMGYDRPADWREGEAAVADAAADLGVTVVLKGRYDVIADGERRRVNRTGNPAMTVGGTGDVLTGITAALAHRCDPLDAAAVAAWVNGTAGDRCADERGTGILASDVIEAIPAAMRTGRRP